MKVFLLLAVAWISFGRAGLAQQSTKVASQFTLKGVVRDPDGAPLKGAEIVISDVSTISDNNGEFSLSGIPIGAVQLEIRRVGYQSVSKSLVTDAEAQTVSIAATLVPNGQVLGTVVVAGKAVDRGLVENGFYQRQRNSNGVFFPPERMQHTAASLSTLMNEVATVKVARVRGSVGIPMAPYTFGIGGPVYCSLNIFLDGVFLPWASEAGIDAVVPQQEVKAIEVYAKASSIPSQMKGVGPMQAISGRVVTKGETIGDGFVECGAILLWTKSFDSLGAVKK